MPDDVALWPTVDVYIPTYNEPMSIVRATVLGAIAMDWPPEKIRVYLLDDGRRDEFREFAAECGIGYVTRNDNLHAKAGNLNNAMAQTEGEFICIFDSDHVPTRAFLQMTMGWMIAEPRNALVQTPHHFYSPDPFQRNLAAGTRVPAEGNMFYGLVQDANDYWNSAFFCGSCAVLRRVALEEIGGFAVETVTEDAHTMLKMHRRGWDSCYLRLPLAAGLATERLILHIGQRVRWARGMIQIFRLDNPMFGPGLTIGQRICYLQAMGHFFFALPRIVFLTAPLAFLLFGLNIIAASPLAIVSYALPHIFHSVATNSRLQRNNRHSFWSEIYETVLALFLVRVTIVTLFAPRRGKFNVTNKGGLLENGYFDLGAVYPNLILAFFLVAGVIRGLFGLLFLKTELLTFQALLLNSIWGFFSLAHRHGGARRGARDASGALPRPGARNGPGVDLPARWPRRQRHHAGSVAGRQLGRGRASAGGHRQLAGAVRIHHRRRAGGGAGPAAALGRPLHAGELPARQRGRRGRHRAGGVRPRRRLDGLERLSGRPPDG